MALLAAALLGACASAGFRWDHKGLLALKAGETSESEAIVLLGRPTSRTNLPGDQRLLVFQYVQVAYVVTTVNKCVSLVFKGDRLDRISSAINLDDELLDKVERNVPVQSRIQSGGSQPISR